MSDLDLIERLASFANDPFGFVQYAFPWGEGELARRPGPEPWQEELLRRVGAGLSPDQAVLEAVASGHGVGKSSVVAWLVLWAMSTSTDTRGVVTANTETQLKTKTWVELAKWYRLFAARHFFKLEATSLFSVDSDRAKTWRTDMVPWSERNPEAFAGLHNRGRRVFVIMDEASSIPAIIWETASGFLSDAETERLWFAFGNPTKSTGRFREAFAEHSGWHTTQVDAREISFTNKEQIAAWERAYGADSDYFRIRVRGVFPRTGESEFISAAVVAAAQARDAEPQRFDALIIGVDVARYGDDEISSRRPQRKRCPLHSRCPIPGSRHHGAGRKSCRAGAVAAGRCGVHRRRRHWRRGGRPLPPVTPCCPRRAVRLEGRPL